MASASNAGAGPRPSARAAHVIRPQQLADADAADAADLVGVAGADAAAGGADGGAAAGLVEAVFFHVVGEDDVRVVAQGEVLADRHPRVGQRAHFIEKLLRVDDNPVGNDGCQVRPQHAGGQQGEFEGLAAVDDGVAGVGSAVVADDAVEGLAEQIDDLALGLVAPLEADDTGRTHRIPLAARPGRAGRRRGRGPRIRLSGHGGRSRGPRHPRSGGAGGNAIPCVASGSAAARQFVS
jgi:hypothetical protein